MKIGSRKATHCNMCGVEHTRETTYVRNVNGRFAPYCKPCYRLRARCHHVGIKPDVLRTILESQNGKCKICDGPASHIDHNHLTGRVRGVVCNQCNVRIGFVERKVKRLAFDANPYIEYLNNSN